MVAVVFCDLPTSQDNLIKTNYDAGPLQGATLKLLIFEVLTLPSNTQ
jgi:hypothetical protein